MHAADGTDGAGGRVRGCESRHAERRNCGQGENRSAIEHEYLLGRGLGFDANRSSFGAAERPDGSRQASEIFIDLAAAPERSFSFVQ
jgi:hypothetical protein